MRRIVRLAAAVVALSARQGQVEAGTLIPTDRARPQTSLPADPAVLRRVREIGHSASPGLRLAPWQWLASVATDQSPPPARSVRLAELRSRLAHRCRSQYPAHAGPVQGEPT